MMQAIVFERLVVLFSFFDIEPHAVIVAFPGDRRCISLFFGRFDGGDVLYLFGFGVGIGGVGFVEIDHSEVVDVIDHDFIKK